MINILRHSLHVILLFTFFTFEFFVLLSSITYAVQADSIVQESKQEVQEVRRVLTDFFNYLHDGKYDKAILLYEPWKEGIGMHGSSWEGLAVWSLPEDRNDKAKVLRRYCEVVGTCLRADILSVKKIADNKYQVDIQFVNNDGRVFNYNCCGSKDSQSKFDYHVHKIDGMYKVRTPPLFRP